MACFTTQEKFGETEFYFGTLRKSCQIGDNIWIFQNAPDDEYEISVFSTKTKTTTDIGELQDPRDWRREFQYVPFHISTYNNKIYLWKEIDDESSRLDVFDPATQELTQLTEFETKCCDDKFYILDNKMYSTIDMEYMQITDMSTYETTNIRLPKYRKKGECNIYQLCELNGTIYLIRTESPVTRSVYQYDTISSRFIQLAKREGIKWAKKGDSLKKVDSFVWTRNNQIYHAFNVNIRLMIDCFDVHTGQWNAVLNATFWHFVSAMFPIGDKVYAMNDRGGIIVREIDLYPSLETLSMVSLADFLVSSGEDASTVALPPHLRNRLENILAWKSYESRLRPYKDEKYKVLGRPVVHCLTWKLVEPNSTSDKKSLKRKRTPSQSDSV